MIIIELTFALIVSLLCAAILLPVTAGIPWWRRHPNVPPIEVFAALLVLFLATWAGGAWLVPIGPKLWGVAWDGFLAVALLVALLVYALIRRPGAPPDSSTTDDAAMARTPIVNLLSLWVLLLLVLAIVAGYAHLGLEPRAS